MREIDLPRIISWAFCGSWDSDLMSVSVYTQDNTPKVPSARHGHSLVTYADKLWLYGGTVNGTAALSDVHVFDPSNVAQPWTELFPTGDVPPPRYRHAAVVIDGVMYVFGGYHRRYLDDFYLLHLGMSPIIDRGQMLMIVQTHWCGNGPPWGIVARVVAVRSVQLCGMAACSSLAEVVASTFGTCGRTTANVDVGTNCGRMVLVHCPPVDGVTPPPSFVTVSPLRFPSPPSSPIKVTLGRYVCIRRQ